MKRSSTVFSGLLLGWFSHCFISEEKSCWFSLSSFLTFSQQSFSRLLVYCPALWLRKTQCSVAYQSVVFAFFWDPLAFCDCFLAYLSVLLTRKNNIRVVSLVSLRVLLRMAAGEEQSLKGALSRFSKEVEERPGYIWTCRGDLEIYAIKDGS